MNPRDHIHAAANCDLCNAAIALHGTCVARGQEELLGVPLSLSIVACQRCRFIFQAEVFSDLLLRALYERDTSFAFGNVEHELPTIHSHLAERQAVISTAMADHGISAGASVLDIGGGRGECCQHLLSQHRVVVSDTTDSPPVDPRIEKVLGLFSPSLAEDEFNVVVMNHVLEHVFSPTAFLQSARNVLKAGGILIVEVPFELYTPLVAKHLGDWRHVVYFCRATLRQFLEKCGFAVRRLVLADGCYGVRRLPVIRAVACKTKSFPPASQIHNSPLTLAVDMLAPVVLASMLKRVASRL